MTSPVSSRRPADPEERRLRRLWFAVAGLLVTLFVVVAARFAAERQPIDAVVALLVLAVAVTAWRHRHAVEELEVGRRGEAESFARILQGLSRSISPDAIVEAIVGELGSAVAADHVVVVRRRSETGALEATLVSSRPGVPSSTTFFPPSDLEAGARPQPRVAVPVAAAGVAPRAVAAASRVLATAGAATGVVGGRSAGRPGQARPAPPPVAAGGATGDARPEPGVTPAVAPASSVVGGPDGLVAERLAARARSVYGLRNMLAAPLRTGEGVVGAIVLSRRLPEPWPGSARRMLLGAANEASAALERAAQQADAETLARTDALTGLPNRRYFDEFCGLLARRRRADDEVGLLIVDVDHFKAINDTWGHTTGDEVLRAVARAVAGAVREGDVPARFGGEEFAVLLRKPGREVSVEVAERVRAAVERLDLRELGPDGVTVSVGVAVATTADEPIAELIDAADRALYEAKRSGRNRVVAAG